MAYGFVVNAEGNAVQEMKKIQDELKKAGNTASVEGKRIGNSFVEMGRKAKETIGELKGLLVGGLAAGGIFGGVEFIKSSKEAFDTMEKEVTRINTVIESTKGAAGFSANAIEEQAKVLSKSIMQGRAEIMDAQGMLLSFTGIKGPIFGQATKAVADFATFFKTDMTSAALMIGKALNDPMHGMTRLQRMGVAFTEEQKKQVALYEQQGQLAKAQGVILKELNTEFGGQAVAAAGTDEGKITMAKKQWTDLKLEIGEIVSKVQVSLIPAFTSMVKYIKSAFNSDAVQFLLHHIKELAAIVLKLLPIWVGYNVVMKAVNLSKEAFVMVSKSVKAAMVEEAMATETAAAEGTKLQESLSSIKFGAVALAIGLVVEAFISWNSKINETIEGISHIKEITADMKQTGEAVEKMQLAYSNVGNLSSTQKAGLLSDIQNEKKEISEKMSANLVPQYRKSITAYEQYESSAKQAAFNYLKSAGPGGDYTAFAAQSKMEEGLRQAVNQNAAAIRGNNMHLEELNKMEADLKKKGISPITAHYASGGMGNSVKDSALHTSELAGAKGGLGEAKSIHIRIDTLQKNTVNGVGDFKKASQSAVEEIIRTLNNLAYSQSRTM